MSSSEVPLVTVDQGLMFNVSIESLVSDLLLFSTDGPVKMEDVSFVGHFPDDPCLVRLGSVLAQNIEMNGVQLILWNQTFRGAIINGLTTYNSRFPSVVLSGHHCYIKNWTETFELALPAGPTLQIESLEPDLTPTDPEFYDLWGYGQSNYVELTRLLRNNANQSPRVVFGPGARRNKVVVNLTIQRGDGVVFEDTAEKNVLTGAIRPQVFDANLNDDEYDCVRVEEGAHDNEIRDLMIEAVSNDLVAARMRSGINIESGAERTVAVGNTIIEVDLGSNPSFATDPLIDNGTGTILDYPTGSYGSNIVKSI